MIFSLYCLQLCTYDKKKEKQYELMTGNGQSSPDLLRYPALIIRIIYFVKYRRVATIKNQNEYNSLIEKYLIR